MKQPHVLVTNDDGIYSKFLHYLVEALCERFTVSVAAPASEQSWIGRAVSRHAEIAVAKDTTHFSESVEAWSIQGTPTDCVNIALGNLMETPPDIVVSGINIGYNTTETLILSSGTIAGAIEGALWGLPAIAFSQYVPGALFEQIRDTKGSCEEHFAETLLASSKWAAHLTMETLENPPKNGTVLNVNFPETVSDKTAIRETIPAKIKLGSLYQEVSKGVYAFRYSDGVVIDDAEDSDRAALEKGFISSSILDFAKIGAR